MHKIVNGKKVELTKDEIKEIEKSWRIEDAKRQQMSYRVNRVQEYTKVFPRIEDQLDYIYHNGIDKWKAEIKKIKDKYPKN